MAGCIWGLSPEIRCMQYAKCIKSTVRGSLAVAQRISRHGLDFMLFLSFSLLIFSMYFCFLQAETPPAAQQNTFYESLRKARRRRHFSVFGSSPKRIDTNWFHQFENNLKIHATHLNKNNIFICLFIYFLVWCLFIYFYYFIFILVVFSNVYF